MDLKAFQKLVGWNFIRTRVHSSRMRTVRCSGRLLGGGCLPRGCVPRVSPPPTISDPRHPLNRITDRTGVKTLPCRNYVTDGNKT